MARKPEDFINKAKLYLAEAKEYQNTGNVSAFIEAALNNLQKSKACNEVMSEADLKKIETNKDELINIIANGMYASTSVHIEEHLRNIQSIQDDEIRKRIYDL